MCEKRERFLVLKNPDLRQLLDAPQMQPDVVIEGMPGAELSIIDVDCHHWPHPPSDEELLAYASAVDPQPDAYWVSHNKGLKLLYIGPRHRLRAVKAAFSVPISFKIELLSHTRHPRAARSDKPTASCGPVSYNMTDPNSEFRFTLVGSVISELHQQALKKLQMEGGKRYGHACCPIEPHVESSSTDCVVVLENGIFCHRCAGRGVTFRSTLKPGYMPFSAIIGNGLTMFDELVKNRVHWTHAFHHLQHCYPNLSPNILQEAYRSSLVAKYESDDPRIIDVFNPDLDILRGEGAWLNAKDFQVTKIDNDIADGLPYCQDLVTDKNGKKKKILDRVRRSQVKNRSPEGYLPVCPYRGITFSSDDQSIPVELQPQQKHKIELLANPQSEEAAFAHIEKSFPALDRRYLMGCLSAAICAEAGSGPPPMLCCSGPSGSAKGETIRLAASMLGEDAVKVQLDDNPEAFMRSIGMLLAAGHRFLVFDEFGKIPGLAKKMSSILQIGSVVNWRPLYENHRVPTRCRGAFFFPCVRFPDFLHSNTEFIRRTRHVRLHLKVPNWAMTSEGDTATWRDRTTENARAANSLLTSLWRTCHEHDFRFL
jgi:hypothetical protein